MVENIPFGELFSLFLDNTFSTYRIIRKKNEEQIGRKIRSHCEKNRRNNATKRTQFFKV